MLCCVEHIFRGDVLGRNVAQKALTIGSFEQFACGACHACSRGVGFEAARFAAAAEATVVAYHRYMTKFASKTVVAEQHFAIHHNARSDTSSERYHDKIFHAARHAVGHFAHCGSVGVVGNAHGQTDTRRHHLRKRNNFCAAPSEIHRVFDGAFVEIGVGCANADAAHLVEAVFWFDKLSHSVAQIVDKLLSISGIVAANGGLRQHIAAHIDEPDFGGCSTYVDADYIRFFHNI